MPTHLAYRWALWLLPILGAALGAFLVGGEGSVIAKAACGALLGGAFSLIGARALFVPPISTALGAAAATAVLASIVVMYAAFSEADTGTIVVGLGVFAVLLWSLTR